MGELVQRGAWRCTPHLPHNSLMAEYPHGPYKFLGQGDNRQGKTHVRYVETSRPKNFSGSMIRSSARGPCRTTGIS
jgi:hypothetical protein